MPLSKRDKEFRLSKISYLDFKTVEADRLLTALYMRLAHNGNASRLRRRVDKSLDDFVDEFCDHSEKFAHFSEHRDIVSKWVVTDLLDVVNRGKPNQAIAAPRPLHGFTYRFRNPKHSRAYGTDQQLYEMLYHARSGTGQAAIDQLKAFCFEGYDPVTGRPLPAQVLDVETQALLHLSEQVEDAADTQTPRESYAPLCVGAADLLAQDVMRLLFYQNYIPRSVMVDYLKILLCFHLSLYHLKLLKLLPELVRQKGVTPNCAFSVCPTGAEPHVGCPYRIGLLLDVAGRPDTSAARLAERSADAHYRRIPAFVKAYFATRKLDEFANELIRLNKLGRPDGSLSVEDVLKLLEPAWQAEREMFFGQRVYGLVEDLAEGQDEVPDPEIKAATEMGLSNFETYIEMLVAVRGPFHRGYFIDSIDSLMLKNRPGALVTQPRLRNAPRRFIFDSRLLEVLLQILVLRPGKHGFYTGEMRIDELLACLRDRYGLYIDQLPQGDGFGPPSITDRQALRSNLSAFIARLREVGFFRDLSDAYVTQTITPRYRINEAGGLPSSGGTA
jgi:hypothetical protein